MNNTRHDRMSITVHRVAIVSLFAQFLADLGTTVERGFQRVDLFYHALEDVDNYIPSHRFYAFLVRMARSEGIENLGFLVGCKYGADSADPHLTKLLNQSPTLYHGLRKASQLTNRTISYCQLRMLRPAQSEYTLFFSQAEQQFSMCRRNRETPNAMGGRKRDQ